LLDRPVNVETTYLEPIVVFWFAYLPSMITCSISSHYFVSGVNNAKTHILIKTVVQYMITQTYKVSNELMVKDRRTNAATHVPIIVSLVYTQTLFVLTIFHSNIPINGTLDINSYNEKDRSENHTNHCQNNIERPVYILGIPVIGDNPRRSISIRVGTCCIPHDMETRPSIAGDWRNQKQPGGEFKRKG
jgi:hypothetical protein